MGRRHPAVIMVYGGPGAQTVTERYSARLLWQHLMDENVHFDNTAHLVDALVAADRNFDLLVFPGERHGYRSPAAKQYASRRVVDYLAEQL